MSEILYWYEFTMKPGTPCWPSTDPRRSLRNQNIPFLITFSEVTSLQDKKLRARLNPIALKLGNGCTSGHGICGLGSLQLPSLGAVLTFMATAFMTANLMAIFTKGLA